MPIPITRTKRHTPKFRPSYPKISKQIDIQVILERKMSAPPKIAFTDPFNGSTSVLIPPVDYISPSAFHTPKIEDSPTYKVDYVLPFHAVKHINDTKRSSQFMPTKEDNAALPVSRFSGEEDEEPLLSQEMDTYPIVGNEGSDAGFETSNLVNMADPLDGLGRER
ncbi:uncharacterized protein I206_101137 [Kwoniella pini CBS 10737]|uniref:Uncharacterized protein n=1 Tax=Kwoniella pini CBS 10737 TaxID=1296096 RepID=A0A1B9IB65_9TREE|nr:uncharacterized protein I206_00189 [Kwoniella pini CBS 10737]OCF52888.1 hypothetical protein I206_00189 [Kwoniella pini CBS 10737]